MFIKGTRKAGRKGGGTFRERHRGGNSCGISSEGKGIEQSEEFIYSGWKISSEKMGKDQASYGTD